MSGLFQRKKKQIIKNNEGRKKITILYDKFDRQMDILNKKMKRNLNRKNIEEKSLFDK